MLVQPDAQHWSTSSRTPGSLARDLGRAGAGYTCVAGTCTAQVSCQGGPACAGVDQCCASGCTNVDTDPYNCGGCGRACVYGAPCVGGVCEATCNGGPVCTGVDTCCYTGCTDTQTNPNNCGGCGYACPPNFTCVASTCTPPITCNGGPPCSGVQQCCPSGCVDIDTNPDNCGKCGLVCPTSYTCVAATCTPPASCHGGPVCTGVDQCCSTGCTDVDTDPDNCGSCGNVCAYGAPCLGGVCQPTCNGGPVCTGVDTCCYTGCVDTQTNPNNCGGCGYACPSGYTCVASTCTPPASCNGGPVCTGVEQCCTSGCTNIDTDPHRCGKCNNACPSTDTCVTGVCTPVKSCNGGPVCTGVDQCCAAGCTNVNTDPDNCGACGNVCAYGAPCVGAVCQPTCNGGPACTGVDTCCYSGCTNTQTDPNNCSGCGYVCPTGWSCVYGGCTPPASCHGGPVCTGVDQCCPSGCTNISTDPSNCGSCGDVCPHGDTCVGAVCTPPASCHGGPVCTGVDQCCSSGCTNIDTDPNNCGSCGNQCAYGAPCVGAVCQPTCNGGPACTGVDQCCSSGCTNTETDPKNCGYCGNVCYSGYTCSYGTCTPPASCNGGPVCTGVQQCCPYTGCTNIDTDPDNCGYCGNVCPTNDSCIGAVCTPSTSCNGGPVCTGGEQCCPSGCTNVNTDPDNCGSCGNACVPGGACAGGACQTCNGGPLCAGVDQCCPSGCVNTTSDPNNCGSCGNVCAKGDSCVGGSCQTSPVCGSGPACVSPETCCSNECVNITSDGNNCGGCNNVCVSGYSCVSSTCTPNEGVFAPTTNPTYLSPGTHSYTSINIPAGVTVYVAGAGSSSGTLTLSSSGPVTIAGKIDMSGGPGTQNTITSENSEEGEAGGGGYTGEPYESAPFSSPCAFVAGNGGSLGYALAGTAGTCPIASTTTCIQQSDPASLLFTSPLATYGGGGGVFTGYRAYGAGGGGPAGGAPGGLGAAYSGEEDCSGVSGGGGAVNGQGGAGTGVYGGGAGSIGETQCAGLYAGVPPAYVGGGGGGSIGAAAIADLPVASTFQTGSAGGGGSADYLNRPVFGGTSGGGGGGGALMITSTSSITITGQVLANGGVGGDAVIGIGSDADCNPQPGAAGGGGSGGVIYLSAPTLAVRSGAVVSAAGGAGGAGSEFATGGAGGAGGMGRIRLSLTGSGCSTLQGSFTPGLPSGCPVGAAQAGVAYIGTYPN